MNTTVEITISGLRQSHNTNILLDYVENFILINKDGNWSIRQARGVGNQRSIETKFEYDDIQDLISWISDQLEECTVYVRANGVFRNYFVNLKEVAGPVQITSFNYFDGKTQIIYTGDTVIPEISSPYITLDDIRSSDVIRTAIDAVEAFSERLPINRER